MPAPSSEPPRQSPRPASTGARSACWRGLLHGAFTSSAKGTEIRPAAAIERRDLTQRGAATDIVTAHQGQEE